MKETVHNRPSVPLLICLVIGIISGSELSGYHSAAYILLCAGIGSLLYTIVQKQSGSISLFILFFVLGYISIQPWIAPDFPSNHITAFISTQKTDIVGIVDSKPIIVNNRQKLVLKVETLKKNHSVIHAEGKMSVTIYRSDQILERGDRISFFGKIRSIRNFENQGGFNYQNYLAYKKIWCSSYAQGKNIKLLNRGSTSLYRKVFDKAQTKISHLIEKTGRGEHQDILKALIIGERHGISSSLREAFNRAGVSHVLAISGLHIGIVATVAFLFFSSILSCFKVFLWTASVRKGAAVLSFFPVLIYALLAGMSPSTQRALLMVTVFLMTFLFEREQDLINTLTIAAILILVIHPPSLFYISFQLSFTSVFFIIYGLSTISKRKELNQTEGLSKKSNVMMSRSITFFLVSFFAILGTLPLVMYYFNQVSLIGLFANFIIIPLIGFIAVPLGLLAVFIYPVNAEIASWFIKGSTAVLIPAIKLVRLFADLKFSAVKTFTPSFFEIGCYYILLLLILNVRSTKNEGYRRNEDNPGEINTALLYRIFKKIKPFMHLPDSMCSKIEMAVEKLKTKTGTGKLLNRLCIILIVLFIGIDICYWLNRRLWNDDFRVTVLDVGQGSANLLELPNGYCMMVDGGGFSDNTVFDIGERVIAPLLWRKKIMTIDTLVLSHPNSDHLNGLIYIASNFNVKNIWTNGETRNTAGYHILMSVVKNKKIYKPDFLNMNLEYLINGVKLNILYPPQNFIDRKKNERWRNSNNNSLVIKAEYKLSTFLFPGDIMERAETEIVELAGAELKSTVLIAPHHGSKSSSSKLFLDAVQPEYVVISAGSENKFGFPHPAIISRYKQLNYNILRTDNHGAITMLSDGIDMEVILNRTCLKKKIRVEGKAQASEKMEPEK